MSLLGKTGFDILSTQYPDPVWIVPDIISTGLTILAGRPKIGKSWLTLQISQAVAEGGIVLGKQVQQASVLYIALEDNERRLQDRMKQQGWTKKAAQNTTFFTAHEFRNHVGPLHRAGWRSLEAIIKVEGYQFCVVDTLSRAFMGLKDMNDSQEVTAALTPLQELSMSNGIGLLFIDHHAKPKGTSPNPIDDIMASTAKSAVLDTAMGLYKDTQSGTTRLLAEGREVQPVDLTLEFDTLNGCWNSKGSTGQFVNNLAEQEIIDFLAAAGGASLADITKAMNKDKGNTSRRLLRLEQLGIIERIRDSSTGKTVAYRYIGMP